MELSDVLEELSFRNLVFFYREELRKINMGADPVDIFNTDKRWRMTKKGVFCFNHRLEHRVQLTDKTRQVLASLEKAE